MIIFVSFMIHVSSYMMDSPYKSTDKELPCNIVAGTEEIVGAEDITMVSENVALTISFDAVSMMSLKEEHGGGPV